MKCVVAGANVKSMLVLLRLYFAGFLFKDIYLKPILI